MQQVAALIGDVVGSRAAEDRSSLQSGLLGTLEQVSGRSGHRLAVTLGDEFQGRFDTMTEALAASWQLHVGTIGIARVRIGLGWGEILVEGEEESPFGQDGPAWWRARDAIERVDSSYPARTLADTGTEWDHLLNAFLTFRDARLEDLDETDAAILAGLADGETQRAVAERLGLHESSVSRRVSRRHLAALVGAAAPGLPPLDA